MRVLLSGLVLLALASPGAAADDFKPEAGFTLIFNGKDLSGWKTQKGDSLEGKTDVAEKRFQVMDGVLVVDDKTKGNLVINTAKEYAKDVHFKFEFLPGPGCNNDLYFRGTKFDLKKSDVKNLKEGEWNQFEIIVQGKNVEFKNNGESLKTLTATTDSGPLGLRAEFGPIQYRRLRVKESP